MSAAQALLAASPPGRAGPPLHHAPSPRKGAMQYEAIPLDDLPARAPQRPPFEPPTERRPEASDTLRRIHAQSSAETSGLGDSLLRMHLLSSTETSGYGDAGGKSPQSPYASAEAVERRVPDRSVWAVAAPLLSPPEGAACPSGPQQQQRAQKLKKVSSLDRDCYHDCHSFGSRDDLNEWGERGWEGDGGPRGHDSPRRRGNLESPRRRDNLESPRFRDTIGRSDLSATPSDDDEEEAPRRRRISHLSPAGLRRSNTHTDGQFHGRGGGGGGAQSAWLKWSHDRRASFKRKVELMERRQTELERVRLSSPVRKARKESVRFVAPHAPDPPGGAAASAPQLHLANVVDEAIFGGHPAFPFDIPPSVTARKAPSQPVREEVKLTLGQWNTLIAFWEHDLFVWTRVVGLLLGLVAVVVGAVGIGTSHWSRLEDHPEFGETHSGLWFICSTAFDNCTMVDFDKWHIGVIGLLLFSVAFDVVAMSLYVCGVCTTSLPKKIYYYHSAGESHLLCAIGSVIAVVLYPLTTAYVDIRAMSLQSFGYSYMLSVVTCACQCGAAFCMCLDDLVHGIAKGYCRRKQPCSLRDKKSKKQTKQAR